MISRCDYLKNPCSSISLPLWKEQKFHLPENMLIVHDSDFNEYYHKEYKDNMYFRLLHNMKVISEVDLHRNYYIKEAQLEQDKQLIVDIINNSYTNISVTENQVIGWTKEIVYDKSLWILVVEKSSRRVVGLGIADFDKNIKEGILEWIQVLPEYRCKGIGKAIVNEVIHRLKEKANFVTVSGEVNNITNPEKMYRKCGFCGKDIWHIMQLKKE